MFITRSIYKTKNSKLNLLKIVLPNIISCRYYIKELIKSAEKLEIRLAGHRFSLLLLTVRY